jgi:VanZ family protein
MEKVLTISKLSFTMKIRLKIIKWMPSALWMGAIFYMSSKQGLGETLLPDYVLHFIAYSILATTYFYALGTSINRRGKIFIVCVLLTSLYGLSDEFHQSFVPTRTPDVKDWLVDTLAGLVISALLVYPSTRSRSLKVER